MRVTFSTLTGDSVVPFISRTSCCPRVIVTFSTSRYLEPVGVTRMLYTHNCRSQSLTSRATGNVACEFLTIRFDDRVNVSRRLRFVVYKNGESSFRFVFSRLEIWTRCNIDNVDRSKRIGTNLYAVCPFREDSPPWTRKSKWNSSPSEWFLERKCLRDTVVNSIDKVARFNLRVP